MTEERPKLVLDERLERTLANGRDAEVSIHELIHPGWTARSLKVFGRLEAALVTSSSGEYEASAIQGGVALGLHLSGLEPNAFRYEG